MGFAISGSAVGISGATFTTMTGPLPNGLADRLPVFRVAGPVFDGHWFISVGN